MTLLPYLHDRDPFATFILHLAGGDRLSMIHYDQARHLVRILQRPWLAAPDVHTMLAMLESAHVRNPHKATIRAWYPIHAPELPPWMLLQGPEDSTSFLLHTAEPMALFPVRSSDNTILRPILDHPPITDPAALAHWREEAARHLAPLYQQAAAFIASQ